MVDDGFWDEHFKGFSIVDCAIATERRIILGLKQDPPENSPTVEDDTLTTKIVINRRDEPPGKDWVFVDLGGVEHPKLGYSMSPDFRLILAEHFGGVFVLGGGHEAFEKKIPLPAGSAVTNIACIDGYVYVTATGRVVFRREGANKWKLLRNGLKMTADPGERKSAWGFRTIDGFSEKDLYAAGGRGDVWQFDGSKWRQLDFPSNVYINELCCAGDGLVYVACNKGVLYAGRNDRWDKIEQDVEPDDLDEIVWYRDRIFIATSTSLLELHKGKLKLVDFKGTDEQLSFGHVSSGTGLLLSAGPKEAFLFDGKNWEVLIEDLEEE